MIDLIYWAVVIASAGVILGGLYSDLTTKNNNAPQQRGK